MPGDRHQHKPFRQIWNYRGQRRKSWSKAVGDEKEEVEDIHKGNCCLKGFLLVVGESIDKRKSRKFKEGPDSKVKLYKSICHAGAT